MVTGRGSPEGWDVTVNRVTLAVLLAGLAVAVSLFVPGVGPPADQCGRPVAERVGNWYCARPAVALVAAVQQPGHCTVSGCYRRYNDFRADFQSTSGVWGYGDTTLGNTDLYVAWQLTGAQIQARPVRYRNTTTTTEVVFSGSLLNAAPGKDGSEIAGSFGLYVAGEVPGATWRAWAPNGHVSHDRQNWDRTQVIQVSWKHPEFPGYWYAFVKSPSARSTDMATWRFYSADQLPANPFGGGHRT